jgi:muramidase (phage lysozyme)
MKNKNKTVTIIKIHIHYIFVILCLHVLHKTHTSDKNHNEFKYPIIDLSTETEPLDESTIKKLLTYIGNYKIRAWCGFLARCEGTYRIKIDTEQYDGIIPPLSQYLVCFTHQMADSFDKHPGIIHETINSKGAKLRSSASGRYQFLLKTWNEILRLINYKNFFNTHKKKLRTMLKKIISLYKYDSLHPSLYKNAYDLIEYEFGPFMQDLAAIVLLYKANAIDDILKSNYERAIFKCAPIWASLPYSSLNKSYYPGQPAFTLAKALEICHDMEKISKQYFDTLQKKNKPHKNKKQLYKEGGKTI